VTFNPSPRDVHCKQVLIFLRGSIYKRVPAFSSDSFKALFQSLLNFHFTYVFGSTQGPYHIGWKNAKVYRNGYAQRITSSILRGNEHWNKTSQLR